MGLDVGAIARLELKAVGFYRYCLVHTLSRYMPYIVLNEYPKSGATWLGLMLSDAIDLPFPRRRVPPLVPAIMHGHYCQSWGMSNVILMWRDGRDVSVSWYHHCLTSKEANPGFVAANRAALGFADYLDVRTNLPAFIEYQFTKLRSPRFTWADFVHKWHGRRGVVSTSYESLRSDTATELIRVVEAVADQHLSSGRALEIADAFSFEKQSGRLEGQEDKSSFLRKGIVGDWENQFSSEAREAFDYFAGDALIEMGYEKDKSWVSAL